MIKKGSSLPHFKLKDLLVSFLENIKERQGVKADLIVQEWAALTSPAWQGMTEAYSFEKGILMVKVKNAPLYSLLVQHEGPKLLKKLQAKFPESGIKQLKFCIG